MDALMGIDYGTTSLKVCLFDAQGGLLAQVVEEMPVASPRPGWLEQDLQEGWERMSRAIRTTLSSAQIPGTAVRAVGVTGTLNETLYDTDGRPLRPAILYGDQRLPPQADIQKILQGIGTAQIASQFGLEDLDAGTLTTILRVLRLPKLLWLRAHEPHHFERVAAVITSGWDFVIFRLTGEVTHMAEALRVDFQIADLFSIPRTWFGKPCQVGEVVGTVSAEASDATGLPSGVPVVMGGTDSPCAFLGAGLVSDGLVLNASGTTDVVAVALDKQPRSPVGYPGRHLIPGMWLLQLSPMRGPVLRWFRDTLLPEGATYADLDRLAAAAQPGSQGLLCLPYFSGEKSVVHDPQARGILLGLGVQHDRRHLARAALEGVAFGLREIIEAYAASGIPLESIHLSGGGARSAIWNQIKADVLARPLILLQVLETGCLGAAMLAAVALEYYPDRRGASAAMTRVARVVEPDPANSQIYEAAYPLYRQLYRQNQTLLAGLEGLRAEG